MVKRVKEFFTQGLGYNDLPSRQDKIERTLVFRGTESSFAYCHDGSKLPDNVKKDLQNAESKASKMYCKQMRYWYGRYWKQTNKLVDEQSVSLQSKEKSKKRKQVTEDE